MVILHTRRLLLLFALSLFAGAARGEGLASGGEGIDADRLRALPLAFERNAGQSAPGVRFLARGASYDTFLSDAGADLVVRDPATARSAVIGLRLANQRVAAGPQPADPLPGKVSYLVGADPREHVIDIDTFARIEYPSVLPGIDLAFYGTQGLLEFDLIVAPNVDPSAIDLQLLGVEDIALREDGSVLLRTPAGAVGLRKPIAYQDIEDRRHVVDASFVRTGERGLGFRLGRYDHSHRLVIDPLVSLAANLWGTASGVALDPAGNIYVVGTTWSSTLPATGGFQTQFAGRQDAYVAKLNAAGTAVVWATYLGARRASTAGLGIAVDTAGSAYVTGTTDASGFPTTPGALQSSGSTFVTKLKPAGNALAYSTFVGAPVAALAVDASGNAFMTGTAGLLAVTPGALQPTKLGLTAPYVAKLNPTGTALVYATYVGGSGNDEGKAIAVDGAGHAYVAGVARSPDFPLRNPLRAARAGATDAFVAKLDPAATALVYSTYLGGNADERAFGVAVDAAGQAVVVGWTRSDDFPTTANAFQRNKGHADPAISNAFVARLHSSGTSLLYASYLGGSWCRIVSSSCFGLFGPDEGIDVATSVAVDGAGFVYVGGYATSDDFPLVDRVQAFGSGSEVERVPFVAKVKPDGTALVYSVALGTRTSTAYLHQVAADGAGGVVAVGNVPGAAFPLTRGSVLGDGVAFAFKLEPGGHPTTLRSSSNPSIAEQPVTLTATVQNPTPGAVVTFMNGSAPLGSVAAIEGVATLSVTLSAGVHRITARNSADGRVSVPHFQVVAMP